MMVVVVGSWSRGEGNPNGKGQAPATKIRQEQEVG